MVLRLDGKRAFASEPGDEFSLPYFTEGVDARIEEVDRDKTDRARELFGLEAEVLFRAGLKNTIDWYRQYGDRASLAVSGVVWGDRTGRWGRNLVRILRTTRCRCNCTVNSTIVKTGTETTMASYATSARAEMNELRRLKTLLPPELQSWVMVEGSVDVNPPLVRSEELGRDEVEIQIDLAKWESLSIDQRNLMFWHEVARIQNDTIPREGWEMAALAIGLGGAVGELWVQDGLLLILALGLCGVSGYRLWQKNNGEKTLKEAIDADEKAIALATRFGYTLPNAYKSLGSALKTITEQTPNRRQRRKYEERLQALRRSAQKAKAKMQSRQDEDGRESGRGGRAYS